MSLGPNVKTNPTPMHAEPFVNTIEDNIDQELIEKVEEVQTLISLIAEQLRKHGFIPANHVDNEACTSDTKSDKV